MGVSWLLDWLFRLDTEIDGRSQDLESWWEHRREERQYRMKRGKR